MIEILNRDIFGNDILHYLIVFGIIFLTFLLSKMMYHIFKVYLKRLTSKTKTKLDDVIVKVIEKPLVNFLMIGGIFYSSLFLEMSEGFRSFMFSLLNLLLILNVAYLFYRFIDAGIADLIEPFTTKSKSKLDDQLVPILRKTLKVFVVIFTIIAVLNKFGYNVTSLLAGLGIGGLAFALAAKDTLGNIFGSITIFTDKPFEVGDKVKIGSHEGFVKEVGLRSTRVKTYDGTIVSIPNSEMSVASIENVSRAVEKKVVLNLSLTYDMKQKKVMLAVSIVKDILKRNKNVGDSGVYFVGFGAYSLDIEAKYWVKSEDYAVRKQTIEDVNFDVMKEFEKAKIEFAFPSQTVYVKK